MNFQIRPYQASDLAAVSRICLSTGDSGRDARSLYRDHELLGHYYTSPYVVLEPELCSLLIHDSQPCGYVMGTRDTARFYAKCEEQWFPALRRRYPFPADDDDSPDANLIRLIHTPRTELVELKGYPAHLHLDLLPVAQGQGWGAKMMAVLIAQLESLAVPGVHLSVGRQNVRAIRFYERMGFMGLIEEPDALTMGRRL